MNEQLRNWMQLIIIKYNFNRSVPYLEASYAHPVLLQCSYSSSIPAVRKIDSHQRSGVMSGGGIKGVFRGKVIRQK